MPFCQVAAELIGGSWPWWIILMFLNREFESICVVNTFRPALPSMTYTLLRLSSTCPCTLIQQFLPAVISHMQSVWAVMQIFSHQICSLILYLMGYFLSHGRLTLDRALEWAIIQGSNACGLDVVTSLPVETILKSGHFLPMFLYCIGIPAPNLDSIEP